MSHYENGHIGKDEYFPMRRGSHTNGYLPNVQVRNKLDSESKLSK